MLHAVEAANKLLHHDQSISNSKTSTLQERTAQHKVVIEANQALGRKGPEASSLDRRTVVVHHA